MRALPIVLGLVGIGATLWMGAGTANAAKPKDPPSPGPTPPAPAPPVTPGGSLLPGVVVAPVVVAPSLGELPSVPAAAAAAAARVPSASPAVELESHLRATKVGQESPAVTRIYQVDSKARGLYAGNIDGLYGPKTALSLARDLGRTPPEPRVWPRGIAPTVSRKAYLAELVKIVTVAK